jgi:hypothetical protein
VEWLSLKALKVSGIAFMLYLKSTNRIHPAEESVNDISVTRMEIHSVKTPENGTLKIRFAVMAMTSVLWLCVNSWLRWPGRTLRLFPSSVFTRSSAM